MNYSFLEIPYCEQLQAASLLAEFSELKTGLDYSFIWERKPKDASRSFYHYTYLGLAGSSKIEMYREDIKEKEDPLSALSQFVSEGKPDIKYNDYLKPFLFSAVSLLSYDATVCFEKVREFEVHSDEPILLAFYPDLFFFSDHEQKRAFVALSKELKNLSLEHLVACEKLAKGDPKNDDLESFCQSSDIADIEPYLCTSKEDYISSIKCAKNYIAQGDAFQVVLSNVLNLPNTYSALEVYARLKAINPSPFHFYVSWPSSALVGASPEVMLTSRVYNSKHSISMRPVAGTRAVSSKMLPEAIFREDRKENAEHVMLVDHARNDIGRVAEIGSVEVSDYLSVEKYKNVEHLVSEVSGVLKEEESSLSALRAAFPIATLAGTPKIRAMEIIAELEARARGLFAGSVFCLGEGNQIDAGVIIRSLLFSGSSVQIAAGSGIVHDSVAELEYQEMLDKMKPALAALNFSINKF